MQGHEALDVFKRDDRCSGFSSAISKVGEEVCESLNQGLRRLRKPLL